MAKPTRADLDAAARAFFEEERQTLDQPRDFAFGDYGDGPEAWVSFAQARIKELEDQLRENRFNGGVRQRARRMAETAGSEFAALDQQLQLHAVQLAARGERQAERWLLHLLAEPWTAFESDDPLFRPRLPAPTLSVNPLEVPRVAGTTVREAVAKFLDYKLQTGVGSSQYEEIERALRWLRAHAGEDRDLGAVTKEELRGLRDAITGLDGRLRGRASMSLEQRQTADPNHRIRSVTAARYWASVLAASAPSSPQLSMPPAVKRCSSPNSELNTFPSFFNVEDLTKPRQTVTHCGRHKSPVLGVGPEVVVSAAQLRWRSILSQPPLVTAHLVQQDRSGCA